MLIDKKDLVKVVSCLKNSVKSNIPSLNDKMTVSYKNIDSGVSLLFKTSDYETTSEFSIDTVYNNSQNDFEFNVSFTEFQNIIKKIEKNTTLVELEFKNKMFYVDGLYLNTTEDIIESISPNNMLDGFSIESNILKNNKRILNTVANNENSINTNIWNILFNFKKDFIDVVSTTGRELTVLHIPCKSSIDKEIVISKKAYETIYSSLINNSFITFELYDNMLRIETINTTHDIRFIDTTFPKYSKIIPTKEETTSIILPMEFYSVLDNSYFPDIEISIKDGLFKYHLINSEVQGSFEINSKVKYKTILKTSQVKKFLSTCKETSIVTMTIKNNLKDTFKENSTEYDLYEQGYNLSVIKFAEDSICSYYNMPCICTVDNLWFTKD